jgi:hypothetical protein
MKPASVSPTTPACQQQRADDGSAGTEKAPFARRRRTRCQYRSPPGRRLSPYRSRRQVRGRDPGCHRDRTKRHQHIDRQRAGVTLGKRMKPLSLLRGELAFVYQPGDFENDPDGWLSFPRVSCRQLARPLEDASEPVIRSSKSSRPLCLVIRDPNTKETVGAATKASLRGASRPSILRDRDLRPLDRTFASLVVPDVALFLPVRGPLRPNRARVRSSARKDGFLTIYLLLPRA